MKFATPLTMALLEKRYKRFLADVTLVALKKKITVHVANPGAMTGMTAPGLTVWLEHSNNPKRKLAYSWKLAALANDCLVCVDTNIANKVINLALIKRQIKPLADYSTIQREVPYGKNSRVDFLLTGSGLKKCYLEVKSVTLSRHFGLAEFPDSVTKRGAKHMAELATVAQSGCRAIILYLIQRNDCRRFTLAKDIDINYALAFDKARAAGVEILCFISDISLTAITLGCQLDTGVIDLLPIDIS